MDSTSNEPCPVCGIVPGEVLMPEAYEVLWDAIPELRAAQEAGHSTDCPECGRQLTFEDRGRCLVEKPMHGYKAQRRALHTLR